MLVHAGHALRRLTAGLVLLAGLLVLAATAATAGEPAAATPRVEIYTTRSCPYCKALRAYLGARGVAFVDHDINQTLETREAFFASGAYGVPLTVIDGQRIHGFDPLRIEAALGAARERHAENSPAPP